MKSIIVREITALVLRPVASSSTMALASSSSSTSTARHIRFADESTPKKSQTNTDKPNVNIHARYYATITFNQIVLSPSAADREVARKLIDVYFEMFKEIIGGGDVDDAVDDEDGGKTGEKQAKKGKRNGREGSKRKRKAEVKGAAGFMEVEDSNSRLMSAILTGVNRALPFAKIDAGDAGYVPCLFQYFSGNNLWTSRLNKHIDTLFLITHTSTFNISLQALVLIHHIVTSLSLCTSASSSTMSTKIADRYYRSLYASLHDPRLGSSSKQAMYLNLFFKSLKSDENGDRVKAMVRRFVQILVCGGVGGSSGGGGTEFVVGGLYLLGEVRLVYA
jgi:ribosome biogenesis protein MAK21